MLWGGLCFVWGEDIKKHPDECVRVIEETIFDNLISDDSV